MIRTAGMRIWERENRIGPPGDIKLPIVNPRWSPNREEDRRNMEDYRNLIVRGIKESVPPEATTPRDPMSHQEEPMVNFEIGPHQEDFEFLVDTGADRSSLRKLPAGMTVSMKTCEVMGAEGKPFKAPIITNVKIKGNSRQVTADFIYLPELETNLLGRDLQVQLGVGVIPEKGKMRVKIMKLTAKDLEEINPKVWAEEGKTGLLDIPPIKIEMQAETPPVRIKQYPISPEGKRGLTPVIEQLLEEGILEPCMSPHNTPILAVRKAEGKYRLVQDLREINKKTVTKYPVVPNPYTLLSQIPPEHAWFTIIDLKDAFWACPLAEECRDWGRSVRGKNSEYTATELLGGYLGHLIGKGYKKLSPERIAGIQAIPAPKTKRDIRKLLGLFGYCRLWLDKYTQSVKFLYEKLVSPEPIEWTEEDEDRLKTLKHKLSTAPVLSLPNLKQEFDLFVNTEEGVAYGVITQEWGGCKKPVAFLSKLLDPVARGWPTCLQAVAATAVLVEETQKLTLQGKVRVHTPHDLKTILSQKAPEWITDSRILRYEIALMNSENLTLTTSKTLNPAQFLSGEPPQDLEHNCLELLDFQTKVREDLDATPLPYGRKLFIDGSSRVIEGKRASGYSVIEGSARNNMKTLETGKLPSSWSAQLCELYALKRGLDLLEGDQGTIYTDSKYAYGVAHTFGKIWEERGYLNSKGKDLAHKELIKATLTSLLKPLEIAIVHVRGHQRRDTLEGEGNHTADQEAKRAAQGSGEPTKVLALTEASREKEEREKPIYEEKELKLIKELGMQPGKHGEWVTPDGRIFLNKPLARKMLSEIHESTHWGTQGLCDHFLREYLCLGVYELAKSITQGCIICQKVNQRALRKVPLGGREIALRPFQSIQIDFTEMPPVQGYKHLLVIIDHLTHWVEAFPTRKETADVVIKTLLEQIIPRYGLINNIDSDRGPHFTARILHETVKALGCYSTIYDGEDQESLIRVHTNVNPTCFDVNQLSTCREEGKQYWVAKNAATFKQRLTGECPIREWFCMEKVNDVKGVKDLIKEKALNIKKMETDEPLSKNLFIDLVERISHELNITNCWICGSTQCQMFGLGRESV
ncbi:hypothetical protein DUI87_27557 [Hirundo rustica rustica]|uniref:Uncharacterized protein n=1 Tax=Hirundo rustica rustica TaxID=333673 RepID=A0A3M0J596_HIRRU|nr:hypothetical protein DUI87_27557 [Hirundo rustica rustica]